ncbi:sensor histidine kinase [Nocardiopsis sp. NPDC050513]|uniref:sensor histidine kinase n=1 Tax=Nocardiopsis sp. NPDC050513 TaxID=3364338 RepID=UPI0037A265D9
MGGDVGGAHGTDGRYGFKLRAARLVILVTVLSGVSGVLVWPVVDVVARAELEDPAPWPPTLCLVPAVGAAALLCVIVWRRINARRNADPWLYWGSLGLVCATYALMANPVFALFTVGVWWGLAVFAAPTRRTARVTAALAVVTWLYLPLSPGEHSVALFAVMWVVAFFQALLMAGASAASLWLWDATTDAVEGQRARARLAVTEERLRFSRDMHDLLGHSLSALAVKSELAGRLLEASPERAAAEMAEVQALARTSLQQVRCAVSGYREVRLADEVESVTALVRAGRAEAVVTGLDGLDLPRDTQTLAAWVVRESVTNVLRHSDATRCRIGFTSTRDPGTGTETLVVEVANDRAGGASGDRTVFGNGLSGLSERVAAGGGSLSAARTGDGGFLVRAVLPVGRRTAETGETALAERGAR